MLAFDGCSLGVGSGFDPLFERIDTRVWSVFHLRIVGKEVAGPVESLLGAADFFGGRFVIWDVELFESELIFRVLRFVGSNASFQFRVLGTGGGISAGAFVAP